MMLDMAMQAVAQLQRQLAEEEEDRKRAEAMGVSLSEYRAMKRQQGESRGGDVRKHHAGKIHGKAARRRADRKSRS
jgi:hypothetical protein